MKAVITDGKGNISISEIKMPEAGPYDCIVKIEAITFCNTTDRHLIEGTFPFHHDYPAVLGHESIGTVVETGEKVKFLKKGDRVLRGFSVYPDEKLDGYFSCWGAFAEYGKVRDVASMISDGTKPDAIPQYFKIQQVVPPEIPLQKTYMMIPQKEVLSSIMKIDNVRGQKFLIAGAGTTASLCGIFLKLKGAPHVTLTARRRAPLEFAIKQSASDEVFILDEADAISPGYDVLIDTTGSMDVIETLIPKLKEGGKLFCYGIYDGMDDEHLFDEIKKKCDYSRIDPDEASTHEEICRLIKENILNPDPFITFTFPFSEIREAWKTIKNKESLKTVCIL